MDVALTKMVRVRAAASSTGTAFAQSDFYDVLDGDNLQGDAYAGFDYIDIEWQ